MRTRVKFSRGFEKALEKQVQGAVQDAAKGYQRMYDDLGSRYKGRPVTEIRPALKRAFERQGGKISDPELTDYAQLIHDGTPIKMKIK